MLGRAGQMTGWTYESAAMAGNNANWTDEVIWKLGYDPERWGMFADPRTLSTVIRDGNYDSVTSSVHWHNTPAGFQVPASLYLSAKPGFFGSYPWPWVDGTTGQVANLPAKARYDAGTPNATGPGSPPGSRFFTLPPCRVLDTRNPAGPLGGPSLQPSGTRTFNVASSACGIPADAVAISVNLTVAAPASPGYLKVDRGDAAQLPQTSAINFSAGRTRANNAIISLASDGSGTIKVLSGTSGTADLILDVNGYFR